MAASVSCTPLLCAEAVGQDRVVEHVALGSIGEHRDIDARQPVHLRPGTARAYDVQHATAVSTPRR